MILKIPVYSSKSASVFKIIFKIQKDTTKHLMLLIKIKLRKQIYLGSKWNDDFHALDLCIMMINII